MSNMNLSVANLTVANIKFVNCDDEVIRMGVNEGTPADEWEDADYIETYMGELSFNMAHSMSLIDGVKVCAVKSCHNGQFGMPLEEVLQYDKENASKYVYVAYGKTLEELFCVGHANVVPKFNELAGREEKAFVAKMLKSAVDSIDDSDKHKSEIIVEWYKNGMLELHL